MPVTSSVTVCSFAARDNGMSRTATSARATGKLLVFMPYTSGADYIATRLLEIVTRKTRWMRGYSPSFHCSRGILFGGSRAKYATAPFTASQ